jgi:hypothetical protein
MATFVTGPVTLACSYTTWWDSPDSITGCRRLAGL